MNVNVDEARRDGEAGGIERFCAVGGFELAGSGDLGHAAVFEQDVLGASMPAAGSMRWPLRIASAVMRGLLARRSSARSTTAMRMATPLRDLLEDGRLRAVGYAGGNLKAANDGAGMQDDGRGSVRGQALAGELVVGLVLFEIELQAGEPLGLNAQHHDHLRLAQRSFEVALDRRCRACTRGQLGQQLFGAAEEHARAEPRQQKHVGAGDAAVQNVADDGDGDAGESFRGH